MKFFKSQLNLSGFDNKTPKVLKALSFLLQKKYGPLVSESEIKSFLAHSLLSLDTAKDIIQILKPSPLYYSLPLKLENNYLDYCKELDSLCCGNRNPHFIINDKVSKSWGRIGSNINYVYSEERIDLTLKNNIGEKVILTTNENQVLVFPFNWHPTNTEGLEYGYYEIGDFQSYRWEKAFELAKTSKKGFKSVLDIGCGAGDLLKRCMEEFTLDKVLGVDKDLKDSKVKNLLEKDFTQLQLPKTDLCFLVEVIEHLNSSELDCLVKKINTEVMGEVIVISTPIKNEIFDNFSDDDHKFEWSCEEFDAWLKISFKDHKVVEKLLLKNPMSGRCTQMVRLESR